MKKLMIAFAAVAMAACAQAATIEWSLSWAVDSKGIDLADSTPAYLVAVSAYSVEQATADLKAGNFNTSKAEISTGLAWSEDFGASVGVQGSSALEGTQSFYAVLINSELNEFLISDTFNDITMKPTGSTVVAMGDFSTYDEGTGLSTSNYDWQAVAVPEPTSGLLLLLGVAGLALRRRRA